MISVKKKKKHKPFKYLVFQTIVKNVLLFFRYNINILLESLKEHTYKHSFLNKNKNEYYFMLKKNVCMLNTTAKHSIKYNV